MQHGYTDAPTVDADWVESSRCLRGVPRTDSARLRAIGEGVSGDGMTDDFAIETTVVMAVSDYAF